MSPPHPFAVLAAADDGLRTTEHVGPRIGRILQHPQQAVVIGRQPLHVIRVVAVGHVGQRLLVSQVPLAEFHHAGYLLEFLEHPLQAVLHALVGVFGKPLAVDLDVPHGDVREQFPAAGLFPPRLLHPPAKQSEFVLGQHALDAQHDMIVRIVGIVDLLFVGQQDVGEDAVAEQQLPGHIVARPARNLDGQNDAQASSHDHFGQFAVGLSAMRGTGRPRLLLLQDEDFFLRPAQFAGAFLQGALPLPALLVVADLSGAALPYIDGSQALKIAGVNLVVHVEHPFIFFHCYA